MAVPMSQAELINRLLSESAMFAPGGGVAANTAQVLRSFGAEVPEELGFTGEAPGPQPLIPSPTPVAPTPSPVVPSPVTPAPPMAGGGAPWWQRLLLAMGTAAPRGGTAEASARRLEAIRQAEAMRGVAGVLSQVQERTRAGDLAGAGAFLDQAMRNAPPEMVPLLFKMNQDVSRQVGLMGAIKGLPAAATGPQVALALLPWAAPTEAVAFAKMLAPDLTAQMTPEGDIVWFDPKKPGTFFTRQDVVRRGTKLTTLGQGLQLSGPGVTLESAEALAGVTGGRAVQIPGARQPTFVVGGVPKTGGAGTLSERTAEAEIADEEAQGQVTFRTPSARREPAGCSSTT